VSDSNHLRIVPGGASGGADDGNNKSDDRFSDLGGFGADSGAGEVHDNRDEVYARLQRTDAGTPRKTLVNVVTVLHCDNSLRGRLAWDQFRAEILLDGSVMTEMAVTHMRLALGVRYDMEPASRMMREAIDVVAKAHLVNHLTDYLDHLRWDGVRRLDKWLVHALGAKDTLITRAMSRRWCLSAVARAHEPGCKVDTLLLLVGPQGAGKRTAVRLLAGEGFSSDSEIELSNRRAYHQIQGVWIAEIPEMTSLSRAGLARAKAFMSSSTDRYVALYGAKAESVPRYTVFAATTNEEYPLHDATGARRYWPVRTPGPLDRDWLTRHRDMLWAEAVAAYRAGEQWHLTPEEERLHDVLVKEFQVRDPWHSQIEAWSKQQKAPFRMEDCISKAAGTPSGKQDRGHQNRAGAILRDLGFEKRRAARGAMPDGSRPWLWSRVGGTS
jgi:putative DNA primase/helicase